MKLIKLRCAPALARITLTCLFSVAAIGCSDGTGPRDVAGLYVLATINGNGLPFVIIDSESLRQTVTSGTLVLEATRTFTERINATAVLKPSGTSLGDFQFEESGTYTTSGGRLTLEFPSRTEPPFTQAATIDGDVITYTTPTGLRVVYRKP